MTQWRLAAALMLVLSGTIAVQAQDAEAPEAPAGEAAAPADPAASAKPLSSAVESLLEKKTESPVERLQTILALADLGAAETAKPLLEEFDIDAMDDVQRAALARALGSAQLLKLARIIAFAPEGQRLATALLDAASRSARDPARLARLVQQLADADAQQRRRAIVDLLEAGQDGAAFCVAALADPENEASYTGLADALVAFAPLSIDPLLGALEVGGPEPEGADDAFRARAIDVLGQIGTERAVPLLLLPAVAATDTKSRHAARTALEQIVGQLPSRGQAEQLLADAFKRRLRGALPMRTDAENRVTLWHWDAANRQVVAEQLSGPDAAAILARSIAQDLVTLDADNRTYQIWQLLTALEVDKLRHGYDQPLPTGQGTARSLIAAPDDAHNDDNAEPADVALLEEVLSAALDRDGIAKHPLIGAALGAVELLGASDLAELLLRHTPESSPLIAALDAGDRRLRFAALLAIMQLNPQREYPGASRVAEAAIDFARSDGLPRAIVGNTRLADAQTLAARLAQAGVDSRVADTGRQLVALARKSADTEMVLIDAAIRRPAVREVVYRLRTSPQTGTLPIALLASSANVGRARAIAAEDPLTIAQFRPHDQPAVGALVDALRTLAGRSTISRAERLAQAGTALTWIAQLSPAQLKLYNLGRRSEAIEASLHVPELTAAAAAALATLGQPSGQRALVDLASRSTADDQARRKAATAFADAVRRHGNLLTSKEIVQQFDRYNQSETADQVTQDILASILDVIESQRPKSKAGDPVEQ